MRFQSSAGQGAKRPVAGSGGIFYLEDVCVNFGTVAALGHIHLKIDQGEVVFITGNSGAGKTTLLRVLSGEQKIDSGCADFFGGMERKDIFISKVFQDLRLLDNQTCEENLFQAFDKGIYKNRDEFYQDLLEFAHVMGIENRLRLKIKDANGGLRQKISFIRAMLSRPDVLLADEPTSSLDYDNAKKIYDILNLYNVKKKLTIVWASHNKDLIKKFTGRIIHLDRGKLIYSGHACFI